MVEHAAAALADVADDAPGPFGTPMPSEPRRAPTTARGTTRASRRETPVARALETRVSARREQETPVGARALARRRRDAAAAETAAPEPRRPRRPSRSRGRVAARDTHAARAAAPNRASDREVVPETRVSRRPEAPRRRAACRHPSDSTSRRRRQSPAVLRAVRGACSRSSPASRSSPRRPRRSWPGAPGAEPAPAPAEPTVLSGRRRAGHRARGLQARAGAGHPRARLRGAAGGRRRRRTASSPASLPDATGPSLLPERFVSGLGTPPAHRRPRQARRASRRCATATCGRTGSTAR